MSGHSAERGEYLFWVPAAGRFGKLVNSLLPLGIPGDQVGYRCYRIEVWRKKTRKVKGAEMPAEIYTEEPMSLGS